MRSTENATPPICWLSAWEFPELHWLDNWRNADSSDFTADTCINAELSNSFKSQEISYQNVSQKIRQWKLQLQNECHFSNLRIQRRENVEVSIVPRCFSCKSWSRSWNFLYTHTWNEWMASKNIYMHLILIMGLKHVPATAIMRLPFPRIKLEIQEKVKK